MRIFEVQNEYFRWFIPVMQSIILTLIWIEISFLL